MLIFLNQVHVLPRPIIVQFLKFERFIFGQCLKFSFETNNSVVELRELFLFVLNLFSKLLIDFLDRPILLIDLLQLGFQFVFLSSEELGLFFFSQKFLIDGNVLMMLLSLDMLKLLNFSL